MRQRKRQLTFTGQGLEKAKDAFGGSLLTSNPKTKRPLDSKFPILLTLRAHQSVLRLPKTFGVVQLIVESTAAKHSFKIYKQANVGNHLHFVVKMPHINAWAAFIRELSGRIAQAVRAILTNDARGRCAGGFWRYRPHTRIVRGWQRAFTTALDYVYLNQLEADGFIDRRETRSLKDLRQVWADT